MGGLVHVGANDAHELKDEPGPLVLIEPQPAAFARLRENFAGRDDVTCINVACAARGPGAATMNVAEPDYSSSLLRPKAHLEILPHITFPETITVPIDTLDRVMAPLADEYDRLLLDCQGYELEVLKGAADTLKRMVWVKCEVSTSEVYEGQALMGDIDRFLARRGFELADVDLHGGVWGDAVFQRKEG